MGFEKGFEDSRYCGVALLWHAPEETRESCIIAIETDPFATGFNGQRRKPGIRYQVAAGVRVHAKAGKDLPVPLPGLNRRAVGVSKQNVTEPEHLIKVARPAKTLGWVTMRITLLKTCGAIP